MAKKNLYDILNVKETATKDDIKKAYRKRARETHPDHNKGKEEEFIKVSKAYLVLADDVKRVKYDQTGQEDFRDNTAEKAMSMLGQMFTDIISNNDENIFYVDIIGSMKETLQGLQQHQQTLKQNARKRIKFLEKISPRIVNKGDKPILESATQKLLQGARFTLAQIEEEEKVTELSLTLLKVYSFKVLERTTTMTTTTTIKDMFISIR